MMSRSILLCLIIAALLGGAVVLAQSQHGASGDLLYSQGQYDEAVAAWQRELARNPKSSRLHTNIGCALYKSNHIEEALKELKAAQQLETAPLPAGRINYNIGNCYFSLKRKEEAIAAYKAALRDNPADMLAKYNLEIALKQDSKQPPSPQQNSSNNNNNGGGNNEPPPEQNNQDQQKQARNNSNDRQSKMTQDEAENILNALRQSERGPTSGTPQRSYYNNSTKRDW